MPILDVEVVGELPDSCAELAHLLAERCAEALKSRPGGTWVRLRELSPDRYAENGPPHSPLFVRVLLAEWPEPERLARQAEELAAAVAGAFGREPAEVHVLFEPPARGRIAFGGVLNR